MSLLGLYCTRLPLLFILHLNWTVCISHLFSIECSVSCCLFLWHVWLQMGLCFSVYDTISCYDLVTSWFLASGCNGHWKAPFTYRVLIHDILPMHKSWEGKCSFLVLVISCCGDGPICLLAKFDIGSCNLADLFVISASEIASCLIIGIVVIDH